MHRGRGLVFAAAIQAATVVGVVTCAAAGPSPPALGTVPLAELPTAPSAVPFPPHSRLSGARPTSSPFPRPTAARPAPPVRLQLTRLGIDATVVTVAMDVHGALGVPDDVRQLGWWRHSAQPGSRKGTVVVDGHVDSAAQGRGALFPLRDAVPGDEITVTTEWGEVRYVVAARRKYEKTELPSEMFARNGRPRLVLITCGGAFDRRFRHYASNVVVYAIPTQGAGGGHLQAADTRA